MEPRFGTASPNPACQTGVPAPRGFFPLPTIPSPLKFCKAGGVNSPPGPLSAPPLQPFPPKSHSQAGKKKQQHKESRRELQLCWEAFQSRDSLRSLLSSSLSSRGSLI